MVVKLPTRTGSNGHQTSGMFSGLWECRAYKSHCGTQREAVPWYLWRVIGTRDIDMPM